MKHIGFMSSIEELEIKQKLAQLSGLKAPYLLQLRQLI